MIIGVPKETKTLEQRVALTPNGAKKLVELGQTVYVERSAGQGSRFSDEEYEKSGARIVDMRSSWAADIVLKVKEPQCAFVTNEYQYLHQGQILFAFLHLASNRHLTHELCKRGVIGIDYATVQLPDGSFPLLRPMSEIAGKLAISEASHLLAHSRGMLLGGTVKVTPVNVTIIGGGTVGTNAAEDALKLGARVRIFDVNQRRVEWLKEYLRQFVTLQGLDVRYQQLWCMTQNYNFLWGLTPTTDLLIGAPYSAGAKAPLLVTKEMVKRMPKGSVIMDIAIDQGGCVETSHPTNLEHPTFVKYGVVHYCVTNMPGLVPRTSTIALTQETLPYIVELATKGFERAVRENLGLAGGVNIYKSRITHEGLAKAVCQEYVPLEKLLS